MSLTFGAGDRNRTCTPKALDPKSSASASSATPALKWWPAGDSNAWPSDEKSDALPTELAGQNMVPAKGLEPSTYWLQVSCSTNWAKPAFKKMVEVNGLEPLTLCL